MLLLSGIQHFAEIPEGMSAVPSYVNGQLITDGDGEREFSRSAVNAKTPLTVRLKPHGGFFAVFK